MAEDNKNDNLESYSTEATANLERAVEEFGDLIQDKINQEPNVRVFGSLQIVINGRKRRISDLGNVESPDNPMKIELMIYNKEQIEEILEFIKQNGFPAKNQTGSQFINVRVPKPSRMQLEEIGDDINRRTSGMCGRLVKAKTNTGLRVKAAMEKEFIDQRIASMASKKINIAHDRCTKEVRILGLLGRKKVLGSFFKIAEKDDPDLLKEINKRNKLETQRIEIESKSKTDLPENSEISLVNPNDETSASIENNIN